MKSKKNIIFTALGMCILSVIGGIIMIMLTGYLGAIMDEATDLSNKEPSILTSLIPGLIGGVGILGSIMGIIGSFLYIREWMGLQIEKNGRIVNIIKRDKNGVLLVLVEFEDGQRKELIANKKLFISAGDSGLIGAQGKHLIYIKRS